MIISLAGVAVCKPLNNVVHFSEIAKLDSKKDKIDKLEKEMFVKLNIYIRFLDVLKKCGTRKIVVP